jgi:carbon storage regulator
MLVLRRKVGESIVLAGVINISVLAVEGERVKIGISAPPDVTIVREELLRASMTDMAPNQGQSSSATPASQR